MAGTPMPEDAGVKVVAPKVSILIRRIPQTHMVPYIVYPDGSVSESWEEFDRLRQVNLN